MFGIGELIMMLVCGGCLGALLVWRWYSNRQPEEDLDGAAAIEEFANMLHSHKNVYVLYDLHSEKEKQRAYQIYVAAVAQEHFKTRVVIAGENYTLFSNGIKISWCGSKGLILPEGDFFLLPRGSTAFSQFLNKEGIEVWQFD